MVGGSHSALRQLNGSAGLSHPGGSNGGANKPDGEKKRRDGGGGGTLKIDAEHVCRSLEPSLRAPPVTRRGHANHVSRGVPNAGTGGKLPENELRGRKYLPAKRD